MRKGISAKVEQLVTEEAKKDAKLRGISFSRYVEVALIHELNKKSKRGSYAELLEIQNFVNEKIKLLELDLPCVDDDEEESELMESIREIEALHSRRKHVTYEFLSNHARKLGYGVNEFQELLLEHGVEVFIE